MGNLSDIVTINIALATAAVKQPGFGIPLVADYHTRFSERLRFYSDLDGMVSDGFVAADAAYKAASACFAQTPQPKLVAVGRRALAPTSKVEITPVASDSSIYAIEFTDHAGASGTASITSDGSATVAEICTALKTAIDALSLSLTVVDGTTKVTVTETAGAGKWFGCKARNLALLLVQQTHLNPGIETDLAAIKLVDSTWYGVGMTTSSIAEVTALGVWVEANKKQCLQDSQDSDIIGSGTSDIASVLKTATEYRTSIEYHNDSRVFAAFALFGAVYPNDPGSITFKFRQCASVPAVPLTATHLVNLRAKNANSFVDMGGVTISLEGKSAAGEFCDVIRDRDWFESRMQTRIYSALLNSKKVPYTDNGISLIAGLIRAQMVEGVTSGFLAESPDWIVTVPKAADISANDKASRSLTGLKFSATIAGAVHAVTVTGTITL